MLQVVDDNLDATAHDGSTQQCAKQRCPAPTCRDHAGAKQQHHRKDGLLKGELAPEKGLRKNKDARKGDQRGDGEPGQRQQRRVMG